MKLEDYFRINGTYSLIDGVYNVKGSISLIKLVEKLPIKFGTVSGHFYCFGNNLISLEGAPKKVGSHFYCFGNKLTSLEGCPTRIGGNFSCDDNLHNNLEYRQYMIMRKLRE